MEKYILGLDIGIASVGWAVVSEESQKVVESGVRLFESAEASKNQERRGFRGIRRSIRRKHHRLERANELLNSIGLNKPESLNDSPVVLRKKGLTEKLEKSELYAALYNIMKHRGVSYIEDIEELQDNEELLADLGENKTGYPCEIQVARFEEYGYFRGTNVVDGKTMINTFTLSGYEKEARKILETQQEYYEEITKEFIENYISLLTTKREYYIGPGNELSRTNYGVYKTSGETKLNLFDELRGKCSIYNGKNGMDGELRAAGASYTVQEYNLMNDLCNIRVDGEKLTKKQKSEVLEYIRDAKSAMKISKVLKKLYKIPNDVVTGYRTDKNNEKEENHSFEAYRSMRKDLSEKGIDIGKYSREFLDAIADVLTLNTETKSILDYFNNPDVENHELFNEMSDEEKEAFVEIRRKRGKLFTKWSSFSYRLIKQIVPEMIESGDEQHTCINRMHLRSEEIISKSKLDYEDMTDEIYNPVVSRAIVQTVKITNALLKKYEFSDIVIEMPRDKNSDDQRKNIIDMQKKNEKDFTNALQYAGLKEENLDFGRHDNLALKLKLYYRQDGRCLYSGNKIDLEKLLRNNFDYEIDHIIPISVSFDDSQANKVLVETYHNRKKSNRTPYKYLIDPATDAWKYDEYKAYVRELRNRKLISNKQMGLLLFEEDITKEEVVKGFINRNINDTSYASKVVLNEFQKFFKEKATRVKVIKGSMTHQFRKYVLKYNKDRDEDFRHHAVDAMICCYSIAALKKFNQQYINIETGEILNREEYFNSDKNEKALYLPESGFEIRKKIMIAEKNIKFSHKVDRKVNRSISDQTIYGTREHEGNQYVVNKIKNIYDNAEYEKFKKKIDKDPDIFLMKQKNPQTWDILMKIIEMYPPVDKKDKVSPFAKYREEFGPVRKFSKKGNGPEIKMLKYLDHKVGNHIDITGNYAGAKNKVVLESLKPYRSDIYYDRNNDCFNVVPIRYNDFKFEKGKYILPISRYEELLRMEKLLADNQCLKELESNGYEFRFSLYKNEVIEIGDESGTEFYRFLSKNSAAKNTFEVKPIEKNKYEKQKAVTAKKTSNIFNKYNVDILGNMYKVVKEPLKLEFKLDNKMV